MKFSNWPVSMLSFAAALFAVTVADASNVWSSAVTISKIEIDSDYNGQTAGVYLYFSTLNPVANSCSLNSQGAWLIGGGTEAVRQTLTTATAAKLAGSQVKILLENSGSGFATCSGGSTTGYPVLRSIQLL